MSVSSVPSKFRSTPVPRRRWRLPASAALIDGLDLCIEFQARPPGFAERGSAGTLETAERRVDQIAGGRPVDLDCARLNVPGEVVHIARIAGDDRRRQTVFGVVGL